MGLFKGIKKAVKKVAKGIKKVASKVWSGVKKIPVIKDVIKGVQSVGKTVGKVMNKIGPLGMIAASFVLGPLAAGLWSSFGTLGTTLASMGGTFAQAAGSVINGVVNAVNWAGGTMSAVGDAITKGASQVAKGAFKEGLNEFTKNMASALTGDAGSAAVQKGIAERAVAGVTEKVTQEAIRDQLAANTEFMSMGGKEMAQEVAVDDAIKKTMAENLQKQAASAGYGEFTAEEAQALARKQLMEGTGSIGGVSAAEAQGIVSQQVTQGTGAKSLMERTTDGLKKAGSAYLKSMGDQPEAAATTASYVPSIMSAKAGEVVRAFGGSQGSAGFSLLSGVQGLEESVRNSTELVTRGFA